MYNSYYINTCTCTCTYTRIIQICIHYLHIYICTQIHIYTDIATDLHILCDSNPRFLHGHSSSARILASKFCKYMLAAGFPYVRFCVFCMMGWGGVGWADNVQWHLHT